MAKNTATNGFSLKESSAFPAYASTITLTNADLSKSHFIDTSGGDVAVEVPDSTADNDERFVRIYKDTSDANIITVQTTSAQMIGPVASETIAGEGKGISIVSTFGLPGYKVIQDSRFSATPSGTLAFFLSDTASDIGGYLALYETDTGEAESSYVSGSLTTGNDQALEQWASEPGEPGITNLLAGIYDLHIHAERTSGTRTFELYWELYKRVLAGTETLLGTSEISGEIDAKEGLDLALSIAADIPILSTDRLVVKTYANVGVSGSNIVATLFMEGDSAARVAIPANSAIYDSRYFVKAGLPGGQIAISGTGAGENLELKGTSHATPGAVFTNDFVGIGTASPSFALEAVGNGATDGAMGVTRANDNNFPAHFYLRSASGTPGSETQELADRDVGQIHFTAYTDTATWVDGATITGHITEDATAAAHGMDLNFQVVKTGTGTLVTVLKLENDGTLSTLVPNYETLVTADGDFTNLKKVTDLIAAFVGTANIVTVGTITTGTWNGADIAVPDGGSGRGTAVAYAPIVGGTTATGAHQSVASVGSSGDVLTSNGAGALPTFQAPSVGNVVAWVNFQGTGTVAINASSNVSSVTDNGTGDYTVNFTASLTDANYNVHCEGISSSSTLVTTQFTVAGTVATGPTTKTVDAVRVLNAGISSASDIKDACVSIIR